MIFFVDLMNKSNTSNTNKTKVEEILNYLSEGFIRGNLNSFKFNTMEQSKGPTTVRIGVTYVKIRKEYLFFKLMILIFRLMLN
jgi:hypothetical protein